MAFRLRFEFTPGQTLGFTVERLADRMFYAAAPDRFQEGRPATAIPAAEGTGIFAGSYVADLPVTPWPDGEYVAYVHHLAEDRRVVRVIPRTMRGGDDGPSPPLAVPKKWNLTADGN